MISPSTCSKCQANLAAAISSGASACPGCGQPFARRDAASATGAPASRAPPSRPGSRSLPWRLLQSVLLVDAAVLLLMGALLILVPFHVESAFQFKDLPIGVSYILGLWGCVLATMGIGYAVAATNPIRHLVWIQIGIARGALECILGVIYVGRGFVTFGQARFGIVVAAAITLAYLVLYPRPPRAIAVNK